MTNGETSRNEACGSPERGSGESSNENSNEGLENDKIDPAVKQNKDTFFDKQKIEKLVNGCVSFLILHFSMCIVMHVLSVKFNIQIFIAVRKYLVNLLTDLSHYVIKVRD